MDIDFEQDTKAAPKVGLEEVSNLANRAVVLGKDIDQLKEELKQKEKELQKIEGTDLPDLMDSFGMAKFTLQSGAQIEIKPVVRAYLPAPSTIDNAKSVMEREELQMKLDAGVKYLYEHGAAAMVKSVLQIDIGKGNTELIAKVIETMEKEFRLHTKHNVSVHPQTLSSYVKECIEQGRDIPFDIFGVFTGRKASIRAPR